MPAQSVRELEPGQTPGYGTGPFQGLEDLSIPSMKLHTDQSSTNLIDSMRRDWEICGTARFARTTLKVLERLEPIVAQVHASSLFDLVEKMSTRSEALSADESAAVFSAILRQAGFDPILKRTLLQALLPAILSIHRRSIRLGADPNELRLADVIAVAWEVLDSWAGQDRAYAAPEVVNAILQRVKRKVAKLTKDRRALKPLANEEFIPAPPDRGVHEEVLSLVSSLPEHRLCSDDKKVVLAVLSGMSHVEISNSTGRSQGANRYRLAKACAVLRDELGFGPLDELNFGRREELLESA